MTSRTLRAATATTVAVALLALPSLAPASSTMLTGIADENVLKGATPGGAEATVAKWKAEGVQDVRMFAQWNKLAPSTDATKAPNGFAGSDPKSYDFSTLDRNVDLVRKHGMSVTLVISGPGPVWASQEAVRRNGTWKPNPTLFGEFATAVTKHIAAKIDRYIVWNEPNVATWLQPQYSCTGTTCKPYSPHLYRQLAQAGYDAIHANDPSARIAVGATSSRGDKVAIRTNATFQPMNFLREMSCVTSKYKAKRSGLCKNFKPVTGYALAYHPHSGQISPGRRESNTGDAKLGDLSRLSSVVDRLTRARRLKVVGAKKMPFWFDEYAYQSSPPDKIEGVSLRRQSLWSQWGWSIAARSSRVQMLTQYEWFDEPTGSDGLYNRWQSGLYFADGRAKPLAAAFANPIYGWRTSKAGYVWGQARPGSQAIQVTLQRRSGSGSGYRDYKVITTNGVGQFKVKVPKSTKAQYRFTFVDPLSKQTRTSDAVGLAKD
ncbi:hypothetical protein PAI11_41760 [Patulibacter medicamentivorans]|uniref:Glycoside hydrolase family 5 domain-containing protein n=1 Tax=Patulibacter medicamentivorans TaxID=1097667 RepID=H0EBE7_9ACTN|nr:hypothetical protein [Patulibacter medicamentivorans]EHN09023.1 hypothetical protein PAI11_41760 [Patulibacter medicamentivorans]